LPTKRWAKPSAARKMRGPPRSKLSMSLCASRNVRIDFVLLNIAGISIPSSVSEEEGDRGGSGGGEKKRKRGRGGSSDL